MVSGYQANLEAAFGDKVRAGYPEFYFVFCDHVFQARHRSLPLLLKVEV
jgi:hypothetical protein